MLKRAAQRLIVLNASVFVLVLGVFSVAVFSSVTHNTDSEKRQRLSVLTDALIGSIEPPDEGEPDDVIPDLMILHGSMIRQVS